MEELIAQQEAVVTQLEAALYVLAAVIVFLFGYQETMRRAQVKELHKKDKHHDETVEKLLAEVSKERAIGQKATTDALHEVHVLAASVASMAESVRGCPLRKG